MNPRHAIELTHNGYTIIQNLISPLTLDLLKELLDESFTKHRKIQINNGNDIITEGVALHLILDDGFYIDFLENLLIDKGLGKFLKDTYFKSNFILNSMSGLNNIPNQPNFSSIVHRDLRFYTGRVPMMINALVMIDDFTDDNGPTLLLQQSHLSQSKPSDEYFRAHASKAIGEAGSVLLFNANVWHASSLNISNKGRRAIPITFTKSNMKQLLDYPRALGYDRMGNFNDAMQQILGYHARVPASLEEWYQPSDKRFYKKNQD